METVLQSRVYTQDRTLKKKFILCGFSILIFIICRCGEHEFKVLFKRYIMRAPLTKDKKGYLFIEDVYEKEKIISGHKIKVKDNVGATSKEKNYY